LKVARILKRAAILIAVTMALAFLFGCLTLRTTSAMALGSQSASSLQRFVSLAQRPTSSTLPDGAFETINRAKRLNMNWKGVPMLKSPFDTAILVELLRELRPATVIELGALAGGSALFIVDQLTALDIGPSHVYSLDITIERLHPAALRAQLSRNLSFVPADVRQLGAILSDDFMHSLPRPILVLEDAHVDVKGVLTFFDRHLREGDYIVIEDTVDPDKASAVAAFLAAQPDGSRYAVDARLCDFFGENMSWNPNSYLRRMRN
jgi:cephalosporin hydroxylase